MKTIFTLIISAFFCSSLIAQDVLYSNRTDVSMWNTNVGDWITVLERNEFVTFTLTKDRKTLLMYSKGSGNHFKYFYKEDGKDMMWLSLDTTFYYISSSEVVNDIEGNTTIKLVTRSGAQSKEYLFDYFKKENLLDCIFYDGNGRVIRNRFFIKLGTIK